MNHAPSAPPPASYSSPTPYGQAPYGQAPHGQAPHGQAPQGQAPHGQAAYGQAAGPGQGPAFPMRPTAHGAPRTSRLPSGAEVLGWGGGLTTLVGVVAVTWDFWSALRGLPLVGLLLTATAVLGVAAAVVGDLDRRQDDQLAANLSSGLWWMTGIAGAFATYVATDVVAGGRAYLALLAASTAATAMLAAAAHRSGRDSILAATTIAAAVTGFAAASTASLDGADRALVVWVVALLVTTGLGLMPASATRTSYAASTVVLFGSAQAVLLSGGSAPAVMVVLVGMVVAAVVGMLRRTGSEGITTALLAVVVACQVLYDLAPQAFSLSAVILLVGLGMTGGCIHLVRRSARDQA